MHRQQWDTDGNGSIEYAELFAPQGLAVYVQQHFLTQGQVAAAPDLESDQMGWFSYWDEDKVNESSH